MNFRLRAKDDRVLWWRGEERIDFADPTVGRVWKGVVCRDVRFDVEDGRPVDEIARAKNEAKALDAEQLDRRDAEWIWAMRRARGEETAALCRTARREHLRAPRVVAMKPPDKPDAGKPFEVAQGILVSAIW